MARKNHPGAHRYEKKVLGRRGYTVFACNLPGCEHYIRAELAKNKISLCNRCGKEMILDTRALKLVKPHCVDCIEIRSKAPIHDKLLEYIENQDKANDVPSYDIPENDSK